MPERAFFNFPIKDILRWVRYRRINACCSAPGSPLPYRLEILFDLEWSFFPKIFRLIFSGNFSEPALSKFINAAKSTHQRRLLS